MDTASTHYNQAEWRHTHKTNCAIRGVPEPKPKQTQGTQTQGTGLIYFSFESGHLNLRFSDLQIEVPFAFYDIFIS